MKNFVTLAGYAKHRGVSRAAVTKAVDAGRIKTITFKGKRGLDKVQADLEWEANTRASAVVDDALGDNTYNKNRTEISAIQAQLLQLKLDELRGELVPVAEIKRAWAEIGTEIKNKVLGLASKLKQRHADLTLEQTNTLDGLARECLEALADGTD